MCTFTAHTHWHSLYILPYHNLLWWLVKGFTCQPQCLKGQKQRLCMSRGDRYTIPTCGWGTKSITDSSCLYLAHILYKYALYGQLSCTGTLRAILHDGSSDRMLAFAMATIQLNPPDPFHFKVPEEWSCWRRHCKQFRVASPLCFHNESAAKQITLLYCPVARWESRCRSDLHKWYWRWPQGLQYRHDKIQCRFQSLLQRYFWEKRFNRRNQLLSESLELYIMALYSLRGYLKAQMICDSGNT